MAQKSRRRGSRSSRAPITVKSRAAGSSQRPDPTPERRQSSAIILSVSRGLAVVVAQRPVPFDLSRAGLLRSGIAGRRRSHVVGVGVLVFTHRGNRRVHEKPARIAPGGLKVLLAAATTAATTTAAAASSSALRGCTRRLTSVAAGRRAGRDRVGRLSRRGSRDSAACPSRSGLWCDDPRRSG